MGPGLRKVFGQVCWSACGAKAAHLHALLRSTPSLRSGSRDVCEDHPTPSRAAARLLELGGELEPPERVAPHRFERSAHRTERVRPRAIEALASIGADRDETRSHERAELQRDGAERHVRHRGMNRAGRALPFPDQTQDLAPAGRGKRGQGDGVERHINTLDKTKMFVKHRTGPVQWTQIVMPLRSHLAPTAALLARVDRAGAARVDGRARPQSRPPSPRARFSRASSSSSRSPPKTAPKPSASARSNRDLTAWRVDAHTWRVLVGIDLDVAPGRVTVNTTATIGGRPVTLATPLTVLRKSFPTRQLKVDEAFVNPPPEALARIERDTRELNKRWANSASTRLWTGPFVRPVPQPNNSAFGTRSVFNGQPRSPHSGADFQSPAGTPIHAPNAGRVVLAEDLYYSGNTVDHRSRPRSVLVDGAPLGDRRERGRHRRRGRSLGKVGATGRVTGPHLHWAIRVNGARVDPLSMLALLGTS